MIKCSRITLTDNEIKDIVTVIRSLEGRKTLKKGATKKGSSQEGGFLNFVRPLMTAAVPLMKNVLTALTKKLTAAASATDSAL